MDRIERNRNSSSRKIVLSVRHSSARTVVFTRPSLPNGSFGQKERREKGTEEREIRRCSCQSFDSIAGSGMREGEGEEGGRELELAGSHNESISFG